MRGEQTGKAEVDKLRPEEGLSPWILRFFILRDLHGQVVGKNITSKGEAKFQIKLIRLSNKFM